VHLQSVRRRQFDCKREERKYPKQLNRPTSAAARAGVTRAEATNAADVRERQPTSSFATVV